MKRVNEFVEIVYDYDVEGFQDKINDKLLYLKSNLSEIIDIKYSTVLSGGQITFYAMIHSKWGEHIKE